MWKKKKAIVRFRAKTRETQPMSISGQVRVSSEDFAFRACVFITLYLSHFLCYYVNIACCWIFSLALNNKTEEK